MKHPVLQVVDQVDEQEDGHAIGDREALDMADGDVVSQEFISVSDKGHVVEIGNLMRYAAGEIGLRVGESVDRPPLRASDGILDANQTEKNTRADSNSDAFVDGHDPPDTPRPTRIGRPARILYTPGPTGAAARSCVERSPQIVGKHTPVDSSHTIRGRAQHAACHAAPSPNRACALWRSSTKEIAAGSSSGDTTAIGNVCRAQLHRMEVRPTGSTSRRSSTSKSLVQHPGHAQWRATAARLRL